MADNAQALALTTYTPDALAAKRKFRASPAALYLSQLATEKCRMTARESMRRITKILGLKDPNAWVGFPWEELTNEHTAYIRQRLIETSAAATIRLTLSQLRSILYCAYQSEMITHEQWARATTWPRLRMQSLPVGRKLSGDEIARLRAHLKELPGAYGEMMLAIFAAALGAGLRREELSRLRTDALADDKVTLLVLGKGQKQRLVPLPPDCAQDVAAWLTIRARLDLRAASMFVRLTADGRCIDAPITPTSMYHRIREMFLAVDIRDATPHDLRRTFASRLLRAAPASTVRELMGHEHIDTTLRYDRGATEEAASIVKNTSGWSAVSAEPGSRETTPTPEG